MVMVELTCRHRMRTQRLAQESYRRVCSCGWASLPYRPNTLGRAAAADESTHHAVTGELLWELVV